MAKNRESPCEALGPLMAMFDCLWVVAASGFLRNLAIVDKRTVPAQTYLASCQDLTA